MSSILTQRIERFGGITGAELKAWREANGLSQEDLRRELDIGSRQTLSKIENTEDNIPRVVTLAILALEVVPKSRRFFGKGISERERRRYIAPAAP